jgi:hypothetical protein
MWFFFALHEIVGEWFADGVRETSIGEDHLMALDGGSPDRLEQCVADMQIGGVRARVSAYAKNLFGPAMRAALAVFVVTMAVALLLVVAPGQTFVIVICWLVINMVIIALSRESK